MSTAALEHTVQAYNLAAASENKIHDDNVAKKFGFEGGLVPGVEVYAYMMHLPVARYGIDWLERGTASCRFNKPVYDGRNATVCGTVQADDSIALRVESDGVLCATGEAALSETQTPPPANEIPTAPLPDYDTRPDAAPESLVEGQVMGTFGATIHAERNAGYLRDVRETLDIYAREGIVHPGLILRFANRALSMNVRLGPWIHVGSEIRNFAIARIDDRLAAPARVVREYDHKGHRFVELDVLITANGERSLARIHHTAIYRPRQVAGG